LLAILYIDTLGVLKMLPFTKMHGCGNDYIYINCFDLEINLSQSMITQLSDRHTGVGGDGVVLILRSNVADAKMRMFNLDGSEGNMCGNAIRCVAKYLYDNGMVQKEQMKIETLSGVKELYLFTKNELVYSVKVNMGAAELRPEKIPVKLAGENIIAKPVNIGGSEYAITCVSMGNPHAVNFVENVAQLDLQKIGPLFENNALFPEKVNTEFVEIASRNCLIMRVWERGSGETQACGTGACASAVAAVLNGFCDKNTDIKVRLPGGELIVKYTDESVYMTGNCVKVFEGVAEI
jgi:carbamoyl-phosphate synthase large subunit